MGTLYIVPTPVGNMEDMTLRAVRILKETDLILAEDTRTSGILLKHFGIQNRLMSHHKFNEHGTSAVIVERLKAGQNIALIAIVSSGLPCDRFCFEGFLPQKKGRQSHLEALKDETRTMIFYESPYRLLKTLQQFAAIFGEDRSISVAREISKVHEEYIRGTIQEAIQHFTKTEPRGEIVIILAGKDIKSKNQKKELI